MGIWRAYHQDQSRIGPKPQWRALYCQTLFQKGTSIQAAALAAHYAVGATKTMLASTYNYVGFYNSIGVKGSLIYFRAYVARILPQALQVYTTAPDQVVLIDLRPGMSSEGLQVSSTVAFTFYGQSEGVGRWCGAGPGCRNVPMVVDVTWMP
jgi:hypothetical protein